MPPTSPAPHHHVVADFVAVDVEHHVPKDLAVVAADPGYLPLIIMSLKMLSLQLSNPASCLSYHAVEDVAAADTEPGAPSHPIVADVIAVDVEPRVLLPIMLLLLLLLY